VALGVYGRPAISCKRDHHGARTCDGDTLNLVVVKIPHWNLSEVGTFVESPAPQMGTAAANRRGKRMIRSEVPYPPIESPVTRALFIPFWRVR
jgi:hypothetical protein